MLRYKIAPKCLLPGPFGHSGVGGNREVEGTFRSYNLAFTYPCQRLGGGTRRQPTDRGKAGSKRSILADARRGPLSVVVAGANAHDI